jgi:hypothetical protein
MRCDIVGIGLCLCLLAACNLDFDRFMATSEPDSGMPGPGMDASTSRDASAGRDASSSRDARSGPGPDASSSDARVAEAGASGPMSSSDAQVDTCEHCSCASGETQPCSAISGAPSCGNAECVNGAWDDSSCTVPAEFCQDMDGDGACSSLCTLQCSGGEHLRAGCDKTDCDDDDPSNTPSTPVECTSPTSCVKQRMLYSAATHACECTDTGESVHEGEACADYSVCQSGSCACNGGAACQVGCRTGTVSCILGPSCSSLQNAPAGTPCGTASFCNDSNVCYTNCTLGSPSCVAKSGCVSGSTTINCAEGSMCSITYLEEGSACITPPNTHCDSNHQCI